MMTVASVLGGEKVLGQKVRRRIDFDALIKKGLPIGIIFHIKREFNLPDEVIARIIGASLRTVARKRILAEAPAKAKRGTVSKAHRKAKTQERLTPVESDRVYRFARIVALADDVFEDRKEALEWLNSPQFGLGGRIPFDMLQTDAGSREVEELLIRIDHGVIS